MSEHDVLVGTFRGICERFVDSGDAQSPGESLLWIRLCDAGFPWVGVSEERGGAGGTRSQARLLWREFGRAGMYAPFVETGLAAWALAEAGLDVPEGSITLAIATTLSAHTASDGTVTVSGTSTSVPWAHWCENLLVVASDDSSADAGWVIALIERDRFEVERGTNIAGEPRDDVRLYDVAVRTGRFAAVPQSYVDQIGLESAISRIQLLSGASESALTCAIQHAQDRIQFGRPIGKFQAVQQLLVQAAEQEVLLESASRQLELKEIPSLFHVAASKVVANSASGVVAADCHQVCGAIGMTAEFSLQRWTRRLWAWAAEDGSPVIWRKKVAGVVLQLDADELWDMVTDGE